MSEWVQRACEAYARATSEYRAAIARGDVVEETDGEECRKGVKYRAVNEVGRLAMGWWHIRRAELAGAKEYDR